VNYRPEIDGLRAVAVLPVILFHAGFELFSGGYVGVDVFFVISGYLITTIIHSEVKERRFSIVRFYERRARRILPALFLVCTVATVFCWAWMTPEMFKDYAQSLVAVNVFASNILFWMQSGYFDGASELKPLLHTWSLAVEEQFYLIFPLLLLILRRAQPRILFTTIVGLSVLSLAIAQLRIDLAPSEAFYLLHTRAWELGVGALAAIAMADGPRPLLGPRVAAATGLGGLTAILVSIFLFDASYEVPGLWGLVPVLGAVGVVLGARQDNLAGRILSMRAMVGVGLVSYSAYLWHQPIFALARIRMLDEISPALWLVLSALSLTLAYISWRWIERPFRNPTALSRRGVFAFAAVGSAVFIAFGGAGFIARGFPDRLPGEVTALAAAAKDVSPRRHDCHDLRDRPVAESCLLAADGVAQTAPPVAVWGDSHSVELAWALSRQPDLGAPVLQLSYSGCPPAVGLEISSSAPGCSEVQARVLRYLVETPEIRDVVVAARWSLYMEQERFDNGEGGHEFGVPVFATPVDPEALGLSADASYQEAVGAGFRAGVERLLEAGKRVSLVYPVPEAGWVVPERLALEKLFGLERDGPLSTDKARFEERSAAAYAALNAVLDSPDLLRIHPAEIFCDGPTAGRCRVEALYFDSNHPSLIAAELIAERVVEGMSERGWTLASGD
jgi:peptidoglycan/LPS O-acetylase OafA/YrhL|tara:strand:- start:34842 stop:36863 length:2022 start_codon:yes stop_codon:yes gene_type:complete